MRGMVCGDDHLDWCVSRHGEIVVILKIRCSSHLVDVRMIFISAEPYVFCRHFELIFENLQRGLLFFFFRKISRNAAGRFVFSVVTFLYVSFSRRDGHLNIGRHIFAMACEEPRSPAPKCNNIWKLILSSRVFPEKLFFIKLPTFLWKPKLHYRIDKFMH
jgi:hypothetical protein